MSKKIISLALVIAMMFTFAMPAFAATPTGTQLTEDMSLSDFTSTQQAKLTSLVKADAVFFSVIKYGHDRSVYYDPIFTSISYNGDGTYDIAVRSGFTIRFYYTVKIYMADDGETISDMTYIDNYGEEWDQTDGMEADDDYKLYDSLVEGLIAYAVEYLTSIISDFFTDLF
ncbi:MAG: hypothetical protein R3Y27_04490 [Clostridia bacterium]